MKNIILRYLLLFQYQIRFFSFVTNEKIGIKIGVILLDVIRRVKQDFMRIIEIVANLATKH